MSKLRAEKLQALIKQELSNMLLREVKDPRVKFVTITALKSQMNSAMPRSM